ncbi:MAG: hypothetical protein GF315_13110 [candidate division Zixibacteria bacterium]|nr:hypothetical protein [candidate division Zixibacteria bacterium]
MVRELFPYKTKIVAVVSVLLFVLCIAHNALSEQNRDFQTTYDRMIEILEKAETMEFDFTRTIKSEYTGASDTASGTVKTKGDDLSRITIDDRIIVTRGDTIRDYLGSHNQLTISLSAQPVFKELFVSEYFGGFKVASGAKNSSGLILELSPVTSDRKYTEIRMILRWNKEISHYMPKSISYIDDMKRQVRWEFSIIDFDPDFGSETFVFQVPEGCRVVNLVE